MEILITIKDCLRALPIISWLLEKLSPKKSAISNNLGAGGSASVEGNYSSAFGGNAGKSGIIPGGPGGNAHVKGDFSLARGGDGSNSPQWDGRGGRRTISPGERMNWPTNQWGFGSGGAGANAPEYSRRLAVLSQIKKDYLVVFPNSLPFIDAGIDLVPPAWTNKRLEELGENWMVSLDSENGGYLMPQL